jgi:putative NADH-flavin reductase
MKLIIFGATGNTGKLLVEQALTAGNQVVAYIRNPAKLNMKSERLTIIQGELADEEKIESALKGADAVLSVLGPRGGSKSKPPYSRHANYHCRDEETRRAEIDYYYNLEH